MEDVEQLSLVFVEALHLNIEHRRWINDSAVFLLDVAGQLHLVLLLLEMDQTFNKLSQVSQNDPAASFYSPVIDNPRGPYRVVDNVMARDAVEPEFEPCIA